MTGTISHWLRHRLVLLAALGILLATAHLDRSAIAPSLTLSLSFAKEAVPRSSGPVILGPIVPVYDYDPVSEPAKYAREMDVVAAPDGAVYAAFITNAPSDAQTCLQSVRVFRSTDSGASWTDDGLLAPEPPPPPCDQPRPDCGLDQLMDPILSVAADGYPRLGVVWIPGCTSTMARSVRGPEGWSRPQSLLPLEPGTELADGSWALATTDGREYYGWSEGLPLAFGGQIAICPNGSCTEPITVTVSSSTEFGGLKLYAHPAGGTAVVWSTGIGVRTALFYRHLWPDGTWETADRIAITDLYPTSLVTFGLRAFSMAFMPSVLPEAIVVFIISSGTATERASFLAYQRSTDGGNTWSQATFLDGSLGPVPASQPQYEFLQFPTLVSNPVTGHLGVLYQMRDVHRSPLLVHTYLRTYDGNVWSAAVWLSEEQPSIYSEAIGAWRFGEYNGLTALADGRYLAAWQSISEEGGVLKSLILTRSVSDPLGPYRTWLPSVPVEGQSFRYFFPYY